MYPISKHISAARARGCLGICLQAPYSLLCGRHTACARRVQTWSLSRTSLRSRCQGRSQMKLPLPCASTTGRSMICNRMSWSCKAQHAGRRLIAQRLCIMSLPALLGIVGCPGLMQRLQVSNRPLIQQIGAVNVLEKSENLGRGKLSKVAMAWHPGIVSAERMRHVWSPGNAVRLWTSHRILCGTAIPC